MTTEEDTVTLVQAVVANAHRLGLTWEFKFATVTNGNDPASIQIHFDNDTEDSPVTAVSIIGTLSIGARVAVITIPPSGQYIIGDLLSDAPRKILGANVTRLGTVLAGVGGTETALPSANWEFEPTMTFVHNGLFRTSVSGGCYPSTTVVSQATIRVRRGTPAAIGAQMIAFRYTIPAGIGASVPTMYAEGYFKNTGATVSTKMSLTLQLVLGATFNFYGDPNLPLFVTFEHVGDVTAQPHLALISPSIN